MAALYVKRIRAGKMTIKQVPGRWQTEVKELMKEVG